MATSSSSSSSDSSDSSPSYSRHRQHHRNSQYRGRNRQRLNIRKKNNKSQTGRHRITHQSSSYSSDSSSDSYFSTDSYDSSSDSYCSTDSYDSSSDSSSSVSEQETSSHSNRYNKSSKRTNKQPIISYRNPSGSREHCRRDNIRNDEHQRLINETDCVNLKKKRKENDKDAGRNQEEVDNGKDWMCCVCMDRNKGAAFIPCGHTFCRVCSRKMWTNRKSCPICNRSIREILDIF